MTTPAFRAVKESIPNCNLTILSSKNGSKITPFIPEIDSTITFDAPWVKNNSVKIESILINEIINKIKKQKFDAAIIFTVYSQSPFASALLCFL